MKHADPGHDDPTAPQAGDDLRTRLNRVALADWLAGRRRAGVPVEGLLPDDDSQ